MRFSIWEWHYIIWPTLKYSVNQFLFLFEYSWFRTLRRITFDWYIDTYEKWYIKMKLNYITNFDIYCKSIYFPSIIFITILRWHYCGMMYAHICGMSFEKEIKFYNQLWHIFWINFSFFPVFEYVENILMRCCILLSNLHQYSLPQNSNSVNENNI